MSEPKVVTRFAPSPTGFLHIGGARTALFNWLFARRHGGAFHLRIEDTDRERHSTDAVDAIIDGLAWLGISWDGEIVSQYARAERHVEIARTLLASGHAYRCFLSPEELEARRTAVRQAGDRFESPWRDADPADAPEGKPYAVRFRAPREGKTIVRDAVQGDVEFPNASLDDLIILRSGADAQSHGGPTYNLAVIVDDHDMGVSHVIRGDDHLINAARQQQIFEALGWPVPTFAHIPLIHGSDGKKLSKRHGALGVEAYREKGYLPEGLRNYLLRLGWSHGDREIFSQDDAISLFNLEGINKAPARLDLEKLDHINAHYIREMSDADFVASARPFLEAEHGALSGWQVAALERGAPFLKERSDTLTSLGGPAAFILIERPINLTGKAAKPLRKDGAGALMREVKSLLQDEADWSSAEALEDRLQGFAEARNIGFGQIGPALRAVLTGGNPAPNIGAVLFSLGQEEALARIKDGLRHPDLA